MVSSGPVPWYNRPPRLFPARDWLERRYGFRLPPLCCATPRPPIDAWEPRRDFPVKRWLDARTAGG
ncbi:MAG TPA: hypothetical protein VH590_20475 [Ktedonobacterales bacterium]